MLQLRTKKLYRQRMVSYGVLRHDYVNKPVWWWYRNVLGKLVYINTMAADALAPCVARSQTVITLTVRNMGIIVFIEREFQ